MASPSLLVAEAVAPDRAADLSARDLAKSSAEATSPDREADFSAARETDRSAALDAPAREGGLCAARAPSEPEVALAARLLAAALGGHSPEGGPRLTRPEIEILRGDDGPVKDEVIRARVAEWTLRQATGDEEREAARARAAEIDAALTAFELERFERNDTSGREIYAAHAALKRALGDGINLVALASEHERSRREREAVEDAAKAERGESEMARWREANARSKAAPMTPRRIAAWAAAVAAALAVAWAIHPPALPAPPLAPAAAALSTELGLRDVHLVGRIVFGASDAWGQLDETGRQRLAAESCARAQALGFDGLVLFDATNDRVATCVTTSDGGVR
jgi:hypothetical protein